jgi:hypothetical protein
MLVLLILCFHIGNIYPILRNINNNSAAIRALKTGGTGANFSNQVDNVLKIREPTLQGLTVSLYSFVRKLEN